MKLINVGINGRVKRPRTKLGRQVHYAVIVYYRLMFGADNFTAFCSLYGEGQWKRM